MNNLKKSFDSFFEGEAKVAVIKGKWGVGKTHFWRNYIKARIKKKDLTQIAYSYISLFGKSSLEDVRKSILHQAKPISDDSTIIKAFERELLIAKLFGPDRHISSVLFRRARPLGH